MGVIKLTNDVLTNVKVDVITPDEDIEYTLTEHEGAGIAVELDGNFIAVVKLSYDDKGVLTEDEVLLGGCANTIVRIKPLEGMKFAVLPDERTDDVSDPESDTDNEEPDSNDPEGDFEDDKEPAAA